MFWVWQKILKPVLEWIGHAETIHTIAQAEFVKTLLLPTVMTVATGAAGWAGHLPLMWVLMAMSLTFMGMTMGLLAGSLYIERKNPLNKLTYTVIFNCDLSPARPALLGSRQQRRASGKQQLPDLSPTQLDVHVSRTIDIGQIGAEIVNQATFPISCILEEAETTVEEFQPPRSKFPKGPFLIPARDKARLADDRIPMDGWPCQKMVGRVHMKIRYGRPGNEKFVLEIDGSVTVIMEHYGFVSQVQFSPKASTSSTIPNEED